MRKITKTILILITALIGASLILCGLYFLRPEVNVVLSEGESVLLGRAFRTPLLSSYRIKVTVYPEVKADRKRIYSPVAALLAQEDGTVSGEAACWGTSHAGDFALSFLPDRKGRWLAAVDSDKKLNTALVYNRSSADEREISALMPASVVQVPYEGYVSFISAGEIRKELDEKRVGTIIVPDPSSTVSLLDVTQDLSLIVSTYYMDALENAEPSFVVREDFDAMIKALLRGETGQKETPYILSPCQNGFEVLTDKVRKLFR